MRQWGVFFSRLENNKLAFSGKVTVYCVFLHYLVTVTVKLASWVLLFATFTAQHEAKGSG